MPMNEKTGLAFPDDAIKKILERDGRPQTRRPDAMTLMEVLRV
jgi:hypothetical protein